MIECIGRRFTCSTASRGSFSSLCEGQYGCRRQREEYDFSDELKEHGMSDDWSKGMRRWWIHGDMMRIIKRTDAGG